MNTQQTFEEMIRRHETLLVEHGNSNLRRRPSWLAYVQSWLFQTAFY
jgi:hypothetical protein